VRLNSIMKLAFIGDTSFDEIQKYTSNSFEKIMYLHKDFSLVINLESSFLPDVHEDNPIKKNYLKQKDSSVFHLKMLTPFVVNLSNFVYTFYNKSVLYFLMPIKVIKEDYFFNNLVKNEKSCSLL